MQTWRRRKKKKKKIGLWNFWRARIASLVASCYYFHATVATKEEKRIEAIAWGTRGVGRSYILGQCSVLFDEGKME